VSIVKKFILLLLLTAMLFGFCACESQEEKNLRQAQEAAQHANDAYQAALENYNDLQNDIAEYEDALAALDQFR
jgi:hypothetical protein